MLAPGGVDEQAQYGRYVRTSVVRARTSAARVVDTRDEGTGVAAVGTRNVGIA